jgi:hypothetical protein
MTTAVPLNASIIKARTTNGLVVQVLSMGQASLPLKNRSDLGYS